MAAAIAGGAMLLWFVTFVVEWHIRTGWQQHWADGAIRAWSNFAMLGWLYQYQTLVGGIAAIGAAAIVYVTARMQRYEAIVDRLSALRDSRIGLINQLEQSFVQLSIRLGHGRYDAADLQPSANLTLTNAAAVASFSPRVARWATVLTRYILGQAEIVFGDAEMSADDRKAETQRLRLLASVASVFLEDSERFFPEDATFHWVAADPESAKARGLDVSKAGVFAKDLFVED